MNIKINVLFFIFFTSTSLRGMETKNTTLRKNLEPTKNGALLISLPSSITIVDTEKPGERLGKCTYVAMTDLIGITHEKPAPFKMLEPRDWENNIQFKKYFRETKTPKKNNLVVYFSDDTTQKEPLHFGTVTRLNPLNNIAMVRSKWGLKSEVFENELYNAPLSYGSSAKFFRLKKTYQQKGKKTILLKQLQEEINNSKINQENMVLLERFLSELANGNNIILSQEADINYYDTIPEKIKYLLLSYPGLDINTYGKSIYTPLMLAAMRGDHEVTKLLINFGAEVNIQNKDGNTALIMAEKRGRDNTISLLLEAGANTEITNNYGYKAKITTKKEEL